MSNSKKDKLKLERMQSKVMSKRCEDQYRKHEEKKKQVSIDQKDLKRWKNISQNLWKSQKVNDKDGFDSQI